MPDNPLARKFRDQAGWLHQRLAQVADLVVLVVAGVPMLIKSELFPATAVSLLATFMALPGKGARKVHGGTAACRYRCAQLKGCATNLSWFTGEPQAYEQLLTADC